MWHIGKETETAPDRWVGLKTLYVLENVVELDGIEPSTSTLPVLRSPS